MGAINHPHLWQVGIEFPRKPGIQQRLIPRDLEHQEMGLENYPMYWRASESMNMISMSWESRSEPGLNILNGMTEGFEHCSSDLDTSSHNGPLVDALSYSWGNPERPRRSGACSLEKAFEA